MKLNRLFSRPGASLMKLATVAALLSVSVPSSASLDSRFEAITFTPAIDNSDYVTVYGSQTLDAWQGHMGIYFDYANRPLQFIGTGGAIGRQSVIDHMIIADVHGALGFTDWFEAGINIPIVLYNWFFTDNAAANEDHAAGMADIDVMMKFKIVDPEKHKVGFAFRPFFTLPSGDPSRYTGNGGLTGGADLITDFMFHERFTMALNLGAVLRDDVTQNGVRIDDQFTYGVAANIKIASNWNIILEGFGKTNMRDFFGSESHSPLEAGGAVRYTFGNSGFSLDIGGTGGIIDGVGAPRYRGYAGLRWTAPTRAACPECPPPAPPPDPRIQGNKIVIWGKIFFDTDKDTIKPISFPVLDDVVDVMTKNPQLALVEVQGHTDARASDAYNMDLSTRRAASAMRYLVSKGIDASRLTSNGYGETRPIADNNTKEGMSENRRVEFIIQQQN